MRPVCCIGDRSTGHDACAVVRAITGIDFVDIEGDLVVLIGDRFETHGCPAHPPHQGIVSEGSKILDVEGIPVTLVGHKIASGGCTAAHLVAEGSPIVDVEL